VVIALLLLLMLEIEVIYLVPFRLLIREVYEKQSLMIKVALQLEEIQIEVVQLVLLEEAALVVEEAEAVE
jgi:replicative superfamily II helicase